MNRAFKKITAAFLALAFVLSASAAGFAAPVASAAVNPAKTSTVSSGIPPASAWGDGNPVVVVPGIGMSDVSLYDDQGNRIPNEGTFKDKWKVLNLCTDDLMNDIWKLVPRLLMSIILQRDCGLSKTVREYMPGMFKYAKHDLNGKPVENVKAIEKNYPLSQFSEEDRADFFGMMPMEKFSNLVGEDKIYLFNFPPFSNTYDQAKRLDEFIQMVKSQTGYKQVSLVPLSLGGVVTNAYFDLYLDKGDVAKVVNVVSAQGGSYVFADLVSKNYASNSAELFYKDMMPQLMNGYQGYLINLALRLLPKRVFNNVLDAAFDVVRSDFFVNTPSMWSIVPADRYPALADTYLGDSAHAVIREQTDRYYAYQSTLRERTNDLLEKGIKIYNIAGYGFNFGHGWGDYQYFQFFACAENINSDGIIQLTSTAMGTYACAPGTTLPADYTQQNLYCHNPAHNHISPDRVVDASTCWLPEQTWYFTGQHHEIAGNDVAVTLACILLGTDTITDIYSNPDFPQFNGSRNSKRIVRDYLPKAEALLSGGTLSAADAAQLQAAVDDANAMLASMVADDAQCDAVEARLYDLLVKAGVYQKPAPPSTFETLFTQALKATGEKLYDRFGPCGFSEIPGKIIHF
ncbi:MAG TPA: hypothetical protein PL044_02445 [Clostridiales bacterium]|nr:hypothetical protein [Clostridiales bacterium]HQK72623.1 hypothetical protein [Clostridiales bacterium]